VQFRLGAVTRIVFAISVVLLLAFVALVRRAGPDPELYPVGGIDVSHHQGEIEWEEVATSEIEFAFIKATEGGDFSDPRFEFNWGQAKAAGIARGAYHFFTFCSPGLDQARHFLTVVPPEPGALTPVADVEFGGNCTSYDDLEEVRGELAIFLAEVERAWGRKPILYLTFRSKLEIADARFDAYPVWFRNVFWSLPNDASSLWIVWQHADDGRVAGIEGPVDQNVLHPDVSIASLQVE
jgi:lysozyme